jgi:hypothetical protein
METLMSKNIYRSVETIEFVEAENFAIEFSMGCLYVQAGEGNYISLDSNECRTLYEAMKEYYE